jgi:hypothetical protein
VLMFLVFFVLSYYEYLPAEFRDVHFDFRIKTMFGSFLPQVVCRTRRAHVLFTLFVFVCA